VGTIAVTADLSHSFWTAVAAFLQRADQLALLVVNKSVVDSQLRRQFFAQTT